MKTLLVFITLSILSVKTIAQNPYLVNIDKRKINKVKRAYSKDSLTFQQIFKIDKIQNLGNGYKRVDKKITGGYIYIKVSSIYNGDSLVSYKLYLQLPVSEYEPNLVSKYIKFYSPTFNVEEPDSTIEYSYYSHNINYNLNFHDTPFKEYSGKLTVDSLPESIQHLLSIYYIETYFSGQYDTTFANIDPKAFELLAYSKNPVTRLHIFKYFQKNKGKFIDISESLEKWYKDSKTSQINVYTRTGCLGRYEKIETLLLE